MRRNTYSQVASLIQPYMTRPGVAVMVAPGGGIGGSDPSTTGYVAGHAQDPDTGEYFGYHWGITGGSADMSAQLQAMINEVGENGGGKIILRSRIPTEPITLRRLTSIYHSNVHIEFRSPVKLGKIGGIRIMGRMDEFVRAPAVSAGKLEINAEEGDTVLTLKVSPTSMQASDFNDGDYIVIRGRNRGDGNAEQKQYVFVTSRDLINNKLNLSAELEETFQPTYGSGLPGEGPLTSSEWPDDATTGSTIYVIRNGQILTNVSTGDYEFEISNVANFAVGDIVRLADTRNEHDMNPSAIRANGLPYENECNMEFFRVIKIVPTTGGNGIVTMDHAVSKNYLAGAPYYGGISKVLPVTNSKISGFDISYDEIQESKNYHAVTVAFAYNCHVFDGYVNGFGYRLGQGVRITDAYMCSGRELLVEGGYRSGSGENYGLTLYKCTGCWYDNAIAKDTRHGFLVQAASYFAMRNCQSWGDKISGFDLHGALETHGVLENCLAVRSNQHTSDANNGAGFRVGNTSHTPGSFHIVLKGCTAVGYQEINCAGFDWLPNSANIEFIGCQAYGAYYGIQFSRNSKQVTPVQDSENIRIINCTFYDCIDRAFRIIGAPNYVYDPETGIGDSNGKVLNLTIKGCATVRCSRHYVIAGNSGVTNLIMEGNDIIDPIALTGQYGYDIKGVLGYTRLRNNSAAGANKGMILQDCPNAIVVTNILQPTIEAVTFTDNGGNTGLAYVDVFSGGMVTAATQLIATNNTMIGATGVKGTYIQGAGTDGVRFWSGYTGYAVYWDGTTWKIGTDGVTNGASLVIADGTGSGLKFYSFPSTGGTIQSILPGDLHLYELTTFVTKNTFDARGDLLVGLSNDVYSRFPLGSPGQILSVDALNDSGLIWMDLPNLAAGTSNIGISNTTPRFMLHETDGPDNQKKWAWVVSGGSLRLRLYSDSELGYIEGLIFRGDDGPNITEAEFLLHGVKMSGTIAGAGSAALYLNPIANGEFGGTQYGMRVVGNPEGATNFVGIGLHGSPNFTNYKASIWVGNEAGRPGLNVGYAQTIATPVWGAIFAGYVGIHTSNPQYPLDVANRMSIRSGSLGTAGVWLADSAGTLRVFTGLLNDTASPIWGVWLSSLWRFQINHFGEAAFSHGSSLTPQSGVAVSVAGIIRTYQQNNFRYHSDRFINAGILYLTALDTDSPTSYIPIQVRGKTIGLWVAPATGTSETEAFRATLGAINAYMPFHMANNNTYREAQGGTLIIGGSAYNSHFCHGAGENTYIRGGKANSIVYINDVSGNVVIGSAAFSTYFTGNFGAWTALSYTTNFSDYNSGSTAVGRYRKIGDIVFIEGSIKRASGNTDMTFATLPVGFRPPKEWNYDTQILCNGTYYHARITINTSGAMTITYPLSTTFNTLTIGYILIQTNFSTI